MNWIPIYDIRQVSHWPGLVLTGVLAGLALAILAAGVACFQPPRARASMRFGTMLVCLAAVFGMFAVSAWSGVRRDISAGNALDAGRASIVEGKITHVLENAVERDKPAVRRWSVVSFQVGDRWFVSPLSGDCPMRIGDDARITFLTDDAARLTPFIVRMDVAHPCAASARLSASR